MSVCFLVYLCTTFVPSTFRDQKSMLHPLELELETFFLLFCFCFCFSRQGFSVALEPVLELALVDQAGLEHTEIYLSLPPESWD